VCIGNVHVPAQIIGQGLWKKSEASWFPDLLVGPPFDGKELKKILPLDLGGDV